MKKFTAIFILSISFVTIGQVSASEMNQGKGRSYPIAQVSAPQKEDQNSSKNHLSEFALTALVLGFAAKVLKNM
ncbi:MAG: hypothetical protein ACEQSC_00305 [Candidatus Nanopelagicaceae bacterium]